MSVRRTSVDQEIDNARESTANSEEEHFPLLMEAVKKRVSWAYLHCGYMQPLTQCNCPTGSSPTPRLQWDGFHLPFRTFQ